MNVRDLIKKLQEMPIDATVFLFDDNIEILNVQYEFGKVQILIDDNCPNCKNLEIEIDSKDEYIEVILSRLRTNELREKKTELKDQLKELREQLKELREQLERIRELTN